MHMKMKKKAATKTKLNLSPCTYTGRQHEDMPEERETYAATAELKGGDSRHKLFLVYSSAFTTRELNYRYYRCV